MFQQTAHVVATARPGPDAGLVILEAPDIASAAQPGQFVMVRCGDLPLRRPLSVHASDGRHIALLFRAAGQGTTWLAARKVGEAVSVTGPLGNGFTLPSAPSRVLLLAGGFGIAPLGFLGLRLTGSHDVLLVQGARTAAELYEPGDALRRLPHAEAQPSVFTRRLTATDDGSAGIHGMALEVALPHLEWADRVYICGPVGMCLAAHRCAAKSDGGSTPAEVALNPAAVERLLDAQVSLELRMGCGVGACYACSIPSVRGRVKVCRDGPVFRFGDVTWEALAT